MALNLNEHAHRRYNILTGEWILVSPHRTQRPWQGKREAKVTEERSAYESDCYLCPGNTRASGATNPNYEAVYSFTNDYSALLEDTPIETVEEGLFRSKGESGICKVICFSPDHSLTLPLMETVDIEKVVQLWQREYLDLGGQEGINHVQIFENKGAIMGCSNPHPHGQIWAQNSIPLEVEKKMAQQLNYWMENGGSLLQDYLIQELNTNERIIAQNEDFVALIPFWAVWPFEMMIAPKKHLQHIAQLTNTERTSFAKIIKTVTIKYDNLFGTSFPYSSGIHQAPTDGKKHEEWHFHMSFYPPLLRSATVKKFMVGYEMFANPQRDITAEQAARMLKVLSETHYSKQSS